ncbi:hypothetical protein KPH14_000008, partial [Odynerus spinipes]
SIKNILEFTWLIERKLRDTKLRGAFPGSPAS